MSEPTRLPDVGTTTAFGKAYHHTTLSANFPEGPAVTPSLTPSLPTRLPDVGTTTAFGKA